MLCCLISPTNGHGKRPCSHLLIGCNCVLFNALNLLSIYNTEDNIDIKKETVSRYASSYPDLNALDFNERIYSYYIHDYLYNHIFRYGTNENDASELKYHFSTICGDDNGV